MEQTKTSVLSNGLIWFGAAVSIAEIWTGTLIAPLGMARGILAILLGHLIGCVPLYFAGLIGAKTEKSAMETVKISFGKRGSLLFSALNVLQLLGWTAIMIIGGAQAASSIWRIGGDYVWCILIGVLIVSWILVGVKRLGKINAVAMGGLFVLTIFLSTAVFKGSGSTLVQNGLSFGSAVELSAAMPLSWLPLISDYTRYAKKKKAATFVSAAVYFLTSSWMYLIGMGAAIFTGENDVAAIMVKAGFGLFGLLIVILATVTTTFLDAYSAGVSAVSIHKKLSETRTAVVVCALGTLLAITMPMTQFEDFLYLIGSVFAPMIAIQMADVFLLHKDCSHKNFQVANLVLWAIGFAIYRGFLYVETPFGITLPVMLLTALLSYLYHFISGGTKNAGTTA